LWGLDFLRDQPEKSINGRLRHGDLFADLACPRKFAVTQQLDERRARDVGVCQHLLGRKDRSTLDGCRHELKHLLLGVAVGCLQQNALTVKSRPDGAAEVNSYFRRFQSHGYFLLGPPSSHTENIPITAS
jgi:hypothetical protein